MIRRLVSWNVLSNILPIAVLAFLFQTSCSGIVVPRSQPGCVTDMVRRGLSTILRSSLARQKKERKTGRGKGGRKKKMMTLEEFALHAAHNHIPLLLVDEFVDIIRPALTLFLKCVHAVPHNVELLCALVELPREVITPAFIGWW
jgi:hypothetical protein